MRLADFIVQNTEVILKEWVTFARTAEPAASVMGEEDLRNFASAMLVSIVADMQTTQSNEKQRAKSLGHAFDGFQKTSGEKHGRARHSFRFSIEQLFSEYRALRASVLRLWHCNDISTSRTDIEDITRFNEAIDELISYSLSSFVKAAQEATEAEVKHREEYLAMLAHELRNPLSPIDAASELLQSGKLNSTQIRNTSEIIGRQVNHMSSLINDLMDASRVTHKMIKLNLVQVDLREVIKRAVEQTKPFMESQRHRLKIIEPGEAITVFGDIQRLVQIFSNLLNNSAKYTPVGGFISLSTEISGDEAIIHVTDNGIGMVPELAERAFDLFSQGERSSDRQLGGLGLGLALVKCLVDLHKGRVYCHSDGLGAGSRFTVKLPRLSNVKNKEDMISTTLLNLVQKPTFHKILIVDDNIDASEMLAMLLESDGHDVMVEHSAEKALSASDRFAADIFLLDIGLPQIDGNELARGLRAREKNVNALFIAITGYSHDDDREKTKASGFNHHLVKPVDIAELSRIIDSFNYQMK